MTGAAARIVLAGVVALAAAACARAEVYEIGTDGTVQVREATGPLAWHRQDETTGFAPDTADASGAIPANAITIVSPPQAPARFRAALATAARRYDVSPSLLASLVWHESRWQPAAISRKGAIGLAQLMPTTARALAVDPHDPAANLDGAAHYIRLMLDRFDGDVERALAAYNAGPGRVIRANGIPPIRETRTYVSAIIDRLASQDAAAFPGDQR